MEGKIGRLAILLCMYSARRLHVQSLNFMEDGRVRGKGEEIHHGWLSWMVKKEKEESSQSRMKGSKDQNLMTPPPPPLFLLSRLYRRNSRSAF